MKTPKRFSSNPRTVDLYAQRFSRWKRKNRIKQLKHTITLLNQENKILRAMVMNKAIEELMNDTEEAFQRTIDKILLSVNPIP